MKMITAIIKPFKLEDIREVLSEIGIQGTGYTYVRPSYTPPSSSAYTGSSPSSSGSGIVNDTMAAMMP